MTEDMTNYLFTAHLGTQNFELIEAVLNEQSID